MIGRLTRRHAPVALGVAGVTALIGVLLLSPRGWLETVRERGFDLVLEIDQQLHPIGRYHRQERVVVVDIDDRSLETLGPWPWPRSTMAKLIDAIAEAKPAAAAVDILFAGADTPDGVNVLAEAGGDMPLALGFVLNPERLGNFQGTPLAIRGTPALGGLWSAAGALGPTATLAARAEGIGVFSLPARGDGVVRQVPLLVSVDGNILPGLALEAIRLAHSASSYLLESDPPTLVTAKVRIPLTEDGLLRLLPVWPQERAARTVSAVDIMAGKVAAGRLDGAVVLVGGSAPALGGLRPTATDPLTPSVQIQADAVEQISAGRFPRQISQAAPANFLLPCALGILAIFAATRLAPLAGVLVVVLTILLAWAAAVAASLLGDRLVDPLIPSVAATSGFVVASVTSFAAAYRREMLVRRRFEQRLAPAIVRRIIEDPDLVKLRGERREITSLFTDIEGLTAMTHRADPEEMVAILDTYFERVTAIVVAHGGMVDKIVGDAVHAIFNAPLDLADHPRRAVECAMEIREWTESYRALPAPAALQLGRTRIGIETGLAIVGDVGIQSRLDYTAYGDVVNAAARLEAANKELGSAICVGPATAARCDPATLRPLGSISLRGRDDALAVYEPWPADAPADWRTRYLAAFALIDRDRLQASARLAELASERESDLVPSIIANRLRGAPPAS
jgi:adenylate cyclase